VPGFLNNTGAKADLWDIMSVEPKVGRSSSVLVPLCANNAFREQAQPLLKKATRVKVSPVLRTADHTSKSAVLRDGVTLFLSVLFLSRELGCSIAVLG
jgi:hypothetical protein